MKVPFTDINRQNSILKKEILAAVSEVIDSGEFVLDERVERFERAFSKFCGAHDCVGLSSGTDALVTALEALGVGKGDEVISVPNTYISTIDAIHHIGARPVLVDVEPVTQNIDCDKIREAITEKTKAIIPVHIFGQTADMSQIMEIAGKFSLHVIEDASQAHGAEHRGRKTGKLGHLACFSFFPTKNLGAMGDAGAIVTDNKEIAESLRLLRNYGQTKKYHHRMIGYNRRLDEIQAAVLEIKLGHLENMNSRRRAIAKEYNETLQNVSLPQELEHNRHVYNLYVIESQRRDDLKKHLEDHGVSTQINYPVPVHMQEAYAHLNVKEGSMPVSEKAAHDILSLPMFPELTHEEISHVADSVNSFA